MVHRILVGTLVDNSIGIEDHVVSVIADNQGTAPSMPKTNRPQAGHLVGFYWYFKQLFLAHKLPKQPGENALQARVRMFVRRHVV